MPYLPAQAARLGEVVSAALPDVKVVPHCVHPAEWASFSRRLRATLGLHEQALAAPIVWSHGRLIGDHTAWAARVRDRYGLELDVGADDVRRIAEDHLERAEAERASRMVRPHAGPGRRVPAAVAPSDALLCVVGADAREVAPTGQATEQRTAKRALVLVDLQVGRRSRPLPRQCTGPPALTAYTRCPRFG